MLPNIFAPKCLATVRPRYRPWSDRPKTDGSEGSVYLLFCHHSLDEIYNGVCTEIFDITSFNYGHDVNPIIIKVFNNKPDVKMSDFFNQYRTI